MSFPKPSLKRDRELVHNLAKVTTPYASAPAGMEVFESGEGYLRLTRIKFTNFALTITGLTTEGGHGSSLLVTMPEALVRLLGAEYNLTMTAGTGGISDTAALVWGVGSAAVGVNNATLLTTEADIIPSVAATLVGGVKASTGYTTGPQIVALTDNSGGTASDTIAAVTGSYVEATMENQAASFAAKINELVAKVNASGTVLRDGTGTALPVYLNVAVPDAGMTDSTTDTITINGTILLFWINQGDVAA